MRACLRSRHGASESRLAPGVVRGEFFHALEDGARSSATCARATAACTTASAASASCARRATAAMVLTSYGRASGFCIDPIEKKPLNHFYPGTSVLSFGTAGCNLGCRFCQNWDISKARADDTLTDSAAPEAVAPRPRGGRLPERRVHLQRPGDLRRVRHRLRRGRARAGRRAGRGHRRLHHASRRARRSSRPWTRPTSTSRPSPRTSTRSCASPSSARCSRRWPGSSARPRSGSRSPPCSSPATTTREAEIDQLCDWFVEHLGPETPLHFTAFHPDFKLLDAPPTPPATLARARTQALAAGLKHVYTGNVHDAAGQSTYCAGCGALLIERDWYTPRRVPADAQTARCP